MNELVVAENPVAIAGTYVYPTTYFYLVRSGVRITENYFPWGCGKGNFISVLENEKVKGNYPKKMLVNEPHDIYAGFAAECGLPGIIGILFLGFAIIKTYSWFRKNTGCSKLDRVLFFLIAIYAIESMALGTLQFRHYWIVFAILNGLYLKHIFISI